MSVQKAMIEAPFTARPDQKIGEVVELFANKGVRAVPVIDEKGDLIGLITLRHILKSVLPISATMEHGIDNLDFLNETTPGAAKKLKKIMEHPVSEIMDGECIFVELDTTKWEAIRLMVKANTILPVVENDSKKLLGVLTAQSTLAELKQVMQEIENEKSA